METPAWDAIVIGSGIGGLTAAGLLAGVAGKKVLVLERHSEPGGLTHTFRRDGASWDVGLHYVGEVQPGSPIRALFDYLSGAQLHWNPMPDPFERFVYPGFEFRVPSDPRRYRDLLVERYPEEARAIRRYFRDVRAVQRWTTLGFARSFVPDFVEPFLRAIGHLTQGKALQTTRHYLERHVRSPELRALLASQWGDYGLPPSRSAFAIHAQIVTHYLRGAWFPEGGSGRIARTFEQGIEAHGGEIRVCQEVSSIVVRDGRAVGVEVIDRRSPQARPCTLAAPTIISNVGAPITFKRLLAQDGEVGAKTAALRELIDRLQGGLSAVTLYLRLKAPVAGIGVMGENHWIHASLDHEAIDRDIRHLLAGRPSHVYVSFPSAKSGQTRFHTAEIIAFVDARAFAAWRDRPSGHRGADYAALKKRIGDGMLDLAQSAIPGLAELVEYAELSTPLSVEHFTSHPNGNFYGLPATPQRYGSDLLGARTPIPGLLLSGSDAGCLGIAGALMGGVGAACQALGPRGYPRIRAALGQAPSRPATPVPPAHKRHATLVAKTALSPTIWQVDFELDEAPATFAPGQFARLRVGEFEWRDYSIAGIDGAKVRLLVSTRTGGEGSRYIRAAEPGSTTRIELPLGRYTLAEPAERMVFVATGTGLAPFLPMFRQLEGAGALGRAELYFGCQGAALDITPGLHPLPPKVVRCFSREQAPAGGVAGRVSDALARLEFDPGHTDFYVCGSAAMVADCRDLLERAGALRLHIESY